MTTITHIFALIVGVVLGGFIVYKFNPTDYVISGKNKVKKGGMIDFKAEVKPKEKRKFKLFKRKNK